MRDDTFTLPERHLGLTVASEVGEALNFSGSVQASFLHAWFPSNPVATAALFIGQGA